MNTVIFRALAPIIVATMLMFSVYITLRGHNEPGGGFIGGLIAAAAVAIFGMASGTARVRDALRFDPVSIAAFGVLLAGGAGLVSLLGGAPFLTGWWFTLDLGDGMVTLSTPMLFDLGVYCTVFGTVAAAVLALEGDGAP